VFQQLAYPVFCFVGQKVPYPVSSFLPDTFFCFICLWVDTKSLVWLWTHTLRNAGW